MNTYETAPAGMAHDDGELVQIQELGTSTANGAGMPHPAETSRGDDTGARRVNPFMVVLWVFGVAQICLGIMAMYASFSVSMMPTSVETATNIHPTWYYLLGPYALVFILTGLLTMIGLFFFHASRWDRRAQMPRG